MRQPNVEPNWRTENREPGMGRNSEPNWRTENREPGMGRNSEPNWRTENREPGMGRNSLPRQEQIRLVPAAPQDGEKGHVLGTLKPFLHVLEPTDAALVHFKDH